jgi:hypothetical protein
MKYNFHTILIVKRNSVYLMKKFFNILVVFVFCFVFVGLESEVFAIEDCETITGFPIEYNMESNYTIGVESNKFSIRISGLNDSEDYTLTQVALNTNAAIGLIHSLGSPSSTQGVVTFNSDLNSFKGKGEYSFILYGPGINACELDRGITLENDSYKCKGYTLWQEVENSTGETDICTYANNTCLNNEDDIYIIPVVVKRASNEPAPLRTVFRLRVPGYFFEISKTAHLTTAALENGILKTMKLQPYNTNQYSLPLKTGFFENVCSIEFEVKSKADCDCKVTGKDDLNNLSNEETLKLDEAKQFSLCKQIPDGPQFNKQKDECLECTGGSDKSEEKNGVWTAIGCIKSDPQSIMQKLIKVGVGISGGVALITFLASGFIFSTSQGDPKAYGKAKEMMTSAIVGLIFIIFSVTVLQFVGYEILKIPGFGGV